MMQRSLRSAQGIWGKQPEKECKCYPPFHFSVHSDLTQEELNLQKGIPMISDSAHDSSSQTVYIG